MDYGKVVPSKSVAAGVVGGEMTDTEAKNITITSKGEKFNGIIITGDSKLHARKP